MNYLSKIAFLAGKPTKRPVSNWILAKEPFEKKWTDEFCNIKGIGEEQAYNFAPFIYIRGEQITTRPSYPGSATTNGPYVPAIGYVYYWPAENLTFFADNLVTDEHTIQAILQWAEQNWHKFKKDKDDVITYLEELGL